MSIYQKLDKSIADTRTALLQISEHITADPNTTTAGKDEKWVRMTTKHVAHVEDLNAAIDEIERRANAEVDKARSDALPRPAGDQGTLAAEMQAQRILNRPAMNDPSAVVEWLEKSVEPSPARTIIVEEIVSRGVLTEDTVNKLLESLIPELHRAIEERTAVLTLINSVYRPAVSDLEGILSYRRVTGRSLAEVPASVQVGLDSTAMGNSHLPDFNVRVPEYKRDSVDSTIANR